MKEQGFYSEGKDLLTSIVLLLLVSLVYEGVIRMLGISEWGDTGLGETVRIFICCFIALPLANHINWRRKRRENNDEPKTEK